MDPIGPARLAQSYYRQLPAIDCAAQRLGAHGELRGGLGDLQEHISVSAVPASSA